MEGSARKAVTAWHLAAETPMPHPLFCILLEVSSLVSVKMLRSVGIVGTLGKHAHLWASNGNMCREGKKLYQEGKTRVST